MPTGRFILCLALLAALAGGCRHHAGWVDRRVRNVPLTDRTHEFLVPAEEPLLIEAAPFGGDGALRARAVGERVVRRFERREIIAQRAYVPYRWYTPVWKPVVMATVVMPFYLSYVDPHDHSGRNWGLGDYLRDVFAYFNIFEAYPFGPRMVEDEWTVLASDEWLVPIAHEEAPLEGARLRLLLNGRLLAEGEADEEGRAVFDLAELATEEMAGEDRRFTLQLAPDARQGGATKDLTVTAETLRSLLARPAED